MFDRFRTWAIYSKLYWIFDGDTDVPKFIRQSVPHCKASHPFRHYDFEEVLDTEKAQASDGWLQIITTAYKTIPDDGTTFRWASFHA